MIPELLSTKYNQFWNAVKQS